MAERASGEVDAGQLMLGVYPQKAAIATVRVELFLTELPTQIECGVQRQGSVTLGEDEAIAFGVTLFRERAGTIRRCRAQR